jgi:hypothetical protein
MIAMIDILDETGCEKPHLNPPKHFLLVAVPRWSFKPMSARVVAKP